MPHIREFIKDRYAVSDVLGEVLMTTITVILMGSIAVFIFSYDGAADLPRTQVKEWMDTQNNMIYLEHSGGESIDTEAIEIVVNVNGNAYTYSSSQIYSVLGNKKRWDLGDRIEIDTYREWSLDIKEEDAVSVYLIDKPSKKVFQKLQLTIQTYPHT